MAAQHPDVRAWLAVAVGGIAGSELRYSALAAWPEGHGFPWTTLGINLIGSFVLAFLTTWWLRRPHIPFWVRAGLGPGVLGSFTTFSSVAIAAVTLGKDQLAVAVVYLAVSLVLGLGTAAAGWFLGARVGRRPSAPRRPAQTPLDAARGNGAER
ncbi:fluoride efflux transporter FluC [Sinomonas albida]|uniref:fluoride efflux transporter FluC n=1 Tax=Sinomonas albida TaxID=369942 RepID=UPI0010A7E9E9|nr:CrcB family protein [Sinomonas albida]